MNDWFVSSDVDIPRFGLFTVPAETGFEREGGQGGAHKSPQQLGLAHPGVFFYNYVWNGGNGYDGDGGNGHDGHDGDDEPPDDAIPEHINDDATDDRDANVQRGVIWNDFTSGCSYTWSVRLRFAEIC